MKASLLGWKVIQKFEIKVLLIKLFYFNQKTKQFVLFFFLQSYDPRILTSKPRCPLEEFDPNSQDSGYGCAYSDEKRPPSSTFQFVEPLKAAPKLRLSLDSPMKSPLRQKQNSSFSANHSVLFRSLSSGYESTDDGFNDLIDMEGLDDEDSGNSAFPNGLSSLITGSLVNNTTPESSKNNNRYFHGRIRRSLSLQIESEAETTPSHKVRSCLFRSPNATSSTAKLTFDENPRSKFKRPEPPSEISPLRVIKKPKICNEEVLQRSYSENDAIKTAMIRDETHDHMTGDFSKPCCLPVIEGGKHHDLKSITVETLAHLLSGKFQHSIEDFQIVDCRYPYEFQGGHIEGAVNLYSREMIEESLLNKLKHTKPKIEADQSCKRQVLIFHCEFSFERGPNLSRVLRSLDRQRNEANYPALHYPEIYLLHGGYRQFFKDEQRWCLGGYCPMRDPKHENELRQYSKNFSKSKSWQEQKQAPTKNLGYKRLGF